MKKNVILTAVISLFLAAAAAVSAQEKTIDFSGNWELDAGKSKLGEQSRIEAMTMIVSQNGKELKVETKTKYSFTPGKEVQGGEKSGGRIRTNVGGNFGDVTQSAAYSLDGAETKSEIPGIPIATTTFKAKFEKDGKLHLISSRALENPKGATAAIKETWTLSADGKILTVAREQEAPGGKSSMELVFNKK